MTTGSHIVCNGMRPEFCWALFPQFCMPEDLPAGAWLDAPESVVAGSLRRDGKTGDPIISLASRS